MSFCFITPSYAPDFQRCKLLSQSMNEFVQPPFQHYIVVDRVDYSLFRPLANRHTQIITVESVLPWWIRREPIFGKLWLSLKTPPIRNWILQQIVKIETARQIAEDVAVFVDSDVAFVRPFCPEQLTQGDQVRLFRDSEGNDVQREFHRKWHESASQLLGLPDVDPGIPDYIGNLITWKRENVVRLCQHLEQVSGRNWIETLGSTWNLSEYVLYGLFVDRVLKEASGQYPDAHNFCHDYWFTQQLSRQELAQFINKIEADKVAVMISAKARIPVEEYQPLLSLA
jgi:hypothetical protein